MRKARPLPANPAKAPKTVEERLAESESIVAEMVEELSSCYESLSAIFRYSAEQEKATNTGEFAQRLLTDLLHIIDADWFILRLVPKGETRLIVFAASEPALELESLALHANDETFDSVEIEAAVTRQEVWFDRTKALPDSDPIAAVKPRALGMVHPFFMGENLIGTLVVGKSGAETVANPPELVFTVNDQCAVRFFFGADYTFKSLPIKA